VFDFAFFSLISNPLFYIQNPKQYLKQNKARRFAFLFRAVFNRGMNADDPVLFT